MVSHVYAVLGFLSLLGIQKGRIPQCPPLPRGFAVLSTCSSISIMKDIEIVLK